VGPRFRLSQGPSARSPSPFAAHLERPGDIPLEQTEVILIYVAIVVKVGAAASRVSPRDGRRRAASLETIAVISIDVAILIEIAG